MVKNIKRFKKEMEKENNPIAEKDENSNFVYLEIVPTTFNLPQDYTIFCDEFRRQPELLWIMKPTARAQGKGIFLVNKLAQLKRWANTPKVLSVGVGADRQQKPEFKEPYIISRYIDKPFLVGGKKFDLRMYVLVTSFRPIKAYLHSGGFARFCTEKYSSDVTEVDNMMIHLTNVAIQKVGEDYNESHGGKWAIKNLRFYLEQTRGRE